MQRSRRPRSTLCRRAGVDLGAGDWHQINQDQIDAFAAATGDHQWIHVDADRAKTGPFGTTIAHGYLTLALPIPIWTELLRIDGIGMAVNYGLNRVRFPAPVPCGSHIPCTPASTRWKTRLTACK